MQLLSEQLDELHNSGDCGNYLAGLADKARVLEGQVKYGLWFSKEMTERINAIKERSRLRAEIEELRARVERLRGIKPELPPRPPQGEGLPRYGIRLNGPTEPPAVPMDDGYWTPWHLAVQLRPAAPDGWRVVPEKLTDDMECVDLDIAGNSHWHGTAEIDPQRLERLWRDLLDAAPQPPGGGEG